MCLSTKKSFGMRHITQQRRGKDDAGCYQELSSPHGPKTISDTLAHQNPPIPMADRATREVVGVPDRFLRSQLRRRGHPLLDY
jgi:hypothetical protein